MTKKYEIIYPPEGGGVVVDKEAKINKRDIVYNQKWGIQVIIKTNDYSVYTGRYTGDKNFGYTFYDGPNSRFMFFKKDKDIFKIIATISPFKLEGVEMLETPDKCEELANRFIISHHLDSNSDMYYKETFVAGYKAAGGYTEEDLKQAAWAGFQEALINPKKYQSFNEWYDDWFSKEHKFLPIAVELEVKDTCDIKRGDCDCSEKDIDCQNHSVKLKNTFSGEGVDI
jgi:hypothetical protein